MLDDLPTVFQIKNYVTLDGMDRHFSRVTKTPILHSHILHFLQLCANFICFLPNACKNNASQIYAILCGPKKI